MEIKKQVIVGFPLSILAQVDPMTRNLPFIIQSLQVAANKNSATQTGWIDRFMPPRKLHFMSKCPN
jgi:hypothetical protein